MIELVGQDHATRRKLVHEYLADAAQMCQGAMALDRGLDLLETARLRDITVAALDMVNEVRVQAARGTALSAKQKAMELL